MSKFFAELTGPVTPEEAHEALVRFTNSHFHNHGKEHARASIPADPKRDDDLRLGAFISNVEELLEAAEDLLADSEVGAFGDSGSKHPHQTLRAVITKFKEPVR